MLTELVGPRWHGRLEYWLRPTLAQSWGGPLNGQAFRQRMVTEILSQPHLTAIIETGTFRGTTTEFLAGFQRPVYTVESHPRYYAYSRQRFARDAERIQIAYGDSRSFLRTLADTGAIARPFCYLDAHWEQELPLGQELQIIFGAWPDAVVMIDDFEVPGTAYGFDAYGPDSTLNLSYVSRYQPGLSAFFPAIRADDETGLRRGSVVLAQTPTTIASLAQLPSLRCH